jgi:hypothetical protein
LKKRSGTGTTERSLKVKQDYVQPFPSTFNLNMAITIFAKMLENLQQAMQQIRSLHEPKF